MEINLCKHTNHNRFYSITNQINDKLRSYIVSNYRHWEKTISSRILETFVIETSHKEDNVFLKIHLRYKDIKQILVVDVKYLDGPGEYVFKYGNDYKHLKKCIGKFVETSANINKLKNEIEQLRFSRI